MIDWDEDGEQEPFVDYSPAEQAAALASVPPNQLLEAIIGKYRNNRNAFFREVMGVKALEKWQAKANDDLDAGRTRISIRSGHGVGKTMWLAGNILHFLFTRTPCKVAVTAPSATQLFDALAPEVKLWLKKIEDNQPLFAGVLTATSDRIFMSIAPEACFCTYRTSRKENPEALQGIHAEHVLLIADEASGVDEAVFEAASGSMSTKGAIAILTGNPTRGTGFFYKTHTLLRHIWNAVRVSCMESTRVDPSYIEEERAYGEDSNRWRIRVLGEFPTGDDDTLISRGLVEAAVGRQITAPRKDPVYWGVDVARSLHRDKSSLAKRKGPVCLGPVKRWQFNDTMKLVGVIKKEFDETPPHEQPEYIFVDVIGVGGGVCDRLIELGLPAVGINVGEGSSVMAKAVKFRDELWCLGRDWFMTKLVSFPDDPATIEELVAPLVAYRSDGNAKVESKDEMRARGVLAGKSPDGADAFLLTFARTGAIASGSLQGTRQKKGALKRPKRGRV